MYSKNNSLITNLFVSTKILTRLMGALLLMLTFNSYALESSIQVHKADQSGANGVSVGLGDNFFNHPEFNWAVSYNHVKDINITWNNDDINFNLDTVDLMLSYRYYPKSYNTFVKSLIVEFQLGAGIALTENKFVWPELENEEKYFSEQGDINSVLGLIVHKKLTKQMSIQIGMKHYPDYSEFGDISSVFIGFNYVFGRQQGY